MANQQDEVEALKAQVAALTARLHAVEQRVGIAAEPLQSQSIAVPPPPPFPATPSPQASARVPAKPMKEKVSLEKRVGFWVGCIGIIAMLFGVASFLKYAFDNNMVGNGGRVAIGIFFGIGFMVGSEVLRTRGYKPFSYSLKALGIGVLYLSLGAAYRAFDPPVMPSSVAFACMVIVTVATIAMALNQDSQLLASFAIVGAFISPVLVSSGQNQEVGLFTYVGLLDLATLVMAVVRPWRWLLWLSFIGTNILGFGWGFKYYGSEERTVTALFTVFFAVIFAAIPIATPFKKSSRLPGPSISFTLLPLLNAAVFFLALFIMYESHPATLTWFALGMAAVYLGLSAAFRRRFPDQDTKVLDLLHVAIAIAFITIAIPIKLSSYRHGHWITMGWLVESAVLLWIGAQTKNTFLRYLATTTLALGIVRLFFYLDDYTVYTPFFNARFATFLVAIAILGGIIHFGQRQAPGKKVFIRLAGIALNVLALIAMTKEAYDYFNPRLETTATYAATGDSTVDEATYVKLAAEQGAREMKEQFSYSAIWLVYAAALMVVGFRNSSAFVRWQALILMAATIVKISFDCFEKLKGGYRILSLMALGAVLLSVSFFYQRVWQTLSGRSPGEAAKEESA